MPEGRIPVLREGMRRRRNDLGLTQEQVALGMGVATSTYHSWETGKTMPYVWQRPLLQRELKASPAEVNSWLAPARLAPDGVSPNWLGTLAALEQGASELWAFEPIAMHGLVQTAAYAAAVQALDLVSPTDAELDRWVQVRLARQTVLDPADRDPLRLSVLLDESVLRRVPGDRQVMADQLDHLAVLAERPTIDVRVLPLDPGTYAAAFGAFTLLTAPGMTDPYMLVLEDRGGAHYLERPEIVATHAVLFRGLQDVALSRADSISLVRTVAQEHRS